jgi:hypothetical protein
VDVPYVMPGGDQPYKFTFHAKIFHTGKISSVKSGSEKDSISVSLSDDNQQAEVRQMECFVGICSTPSKIVRDKIEVN